jgi:NhaP-type Na+/H+ or K+/H+ antiporter
MKHHIFIWLLFGMTTAWVVVTMLPWLLVGPKRLSLRAAFSIGQILTRLYDRAEASAR